MSAMSGRCVLGADASCARAALTARGRGRRSTAARCSSLRHQTRPPRPAGIGPLGPRTLRDDLPVGRERRERGDCTTARAFDPGALGAACSTTFKLVLLCGVVGQMMRTQFLPGNTPVVLSKVAFNLLLPCMLCSKVAYTLSKIGSLSMIGVPVVGVLQIVIGIAVGTFLFDLFTPKGQKAPQAALAAAGGGSLAASEDAAHVEAKRQRSEAIRSMVKASSGFGNSITLPLIFFSTLLTPAQFDMAGGYIALFLIAWSPLLWSVGYSMFVKTEPTAASQAAKEGGLLAKAISFVVSLREYVNAPLLGVLCGIIIGATPLSKVFFDTAAATTPGTAEGALALAGVAGKVLLGVPRGAMELVLLLGGSLLAVQTVVLAASLLPTDPKTKINLVELVAPADGEETRALLVVLFTRFVVMPLVGLATIVLFQQLSWLPDDPICFLVLLVQAVMPSAQNTVLLLQLEPETRPLAPVMARLLLQVYLLAVIPLAFWMGLFIPMLGVGA